MWLYLIKSWISCGQASWYLESIIFVFISRSRQYIKAGDIQSLYWDTQ